MEAVAALGLAANILQFIEFGVVILSKGREIHTSINGTLVENVTIEAVVNHLKDTLARLQAYPKVRSPAAEKLRTECDRLINDILGALDKAKSKGSPSKWKSLRKALKSVRSKSQIEQWLRQLESLRGEYNTELEVEILTTIDLRGVEQTQSFQDLDASQKALTQTLLNAIRDGKDNLEAVAEKHAIDLGALIQQELDRSRAHVSMEATMTRNTNAAEHADTRSHVTVESEASRQFIEQRSVADVMTITEFIVKTADTQVQAQQHGLDAVEQSIQSAVFSEVRNATQTLSVEMALQNFTTGLQILDGDRAVIDSLSHQLADTTAQLRQMEAQRTKTLTFSKWEHFQTRKTISPTNYSGLTRQDEQGSIPPERTRNPVAQYKLESDDHPAKAIHDLANLGSDQFDQRAFDSTTELSLDALKHDITEVIQSTPEESSHITYSDTTPTRLLSMAENRPYTVLRTPADCQEYFVAGRIFESQLDRRHVAAVGNKLSGPLRRLLGAGDSRKYTESSMVQSVVLRPGRYSSLCAPIITCGKRYYMLAHWSMDDINDCVPVCLHRDEITSGDPVSEEHQIAVRLNVKTPPFKLGSWIDFRATYEHAHIPHVLDVGIIDRNSLERLRTSAAEHNDLYPSTAPQKSILRRALLNLVKTHLSYRRPDIGEPRRRCQLATTSSCYIYVCTLVGSDNSTWQALKKRLQAQYEHFPGINEGSIFILLLSFELLSNAKQRTQEPFNLHELERDAEISRKSVVMTVDPLGIVSYYESLPDISQIELI